MLQKQAFETALIINDLNGIQNMEFLMFETFFSDMRKAAGRLDLEESPLQGRRALFSLMLALLIL